MRHFIFSVVAVACLWATIPGTAGAQVKSIPYGDMEHWMVRQVDESLVIGGKTKFLYEVAKGDTLKNNTPFVPDLKVSPWATSSVLAVVKGVTKSSCTVFPEYHGNGHAARLETRIERVKVLGLINISVLATGTMFLGEIVEPVRDTKDPQAKLMMGIPFTERPKSIIYDYKFEQGSDNGKRLKMTGFSRVQEVPGVNGAEMCLLLQKRWEDADGNVYAKRVGTAWVRYDKNTKGWVNANEVRIIYGDARKDSEFQPYMDLIEPGDGAPHCKNSKGQAVSIKEVGWASPDEKPTHIILRFSSGHGGAYVGSPGAMFHIDNVKLRY